MLSSVQPHTKPENRWNRVEPLRNPLLLLLHPLGVSSVSPEPPEIPQNVGTVLFSKTSPHSIQSFGTR